jgi:hypothetical protein
MHARAHGRFGGEQQLRLVQELADLRCHGHQLIAAPQHPHVAIAQQAEPGLELGLEHVLGGVEQIMADAQEGEIVGAQPFEELHRFGDLVGRERRRALLQAGDDLAEMAYHGAPIPHAEADVGQHLLECRNDRAALRVVIDAPDMDMDEAFPQGSGRLQALEVHKPPVRVARHREDRVNHETDVDCPLRQLRQDRVHQERHVVIDELQDRDVLEPVPRNGAGRGLETDFRRARRPDGQQGPGALRQRRDLARRVGQKVLGHGAGEQPADEGPGNVPALGEQRRRGIGQCRDGLRVVRARLVVDRHGIPDAIPWARPTTTQLSLLAQCLPSAKPARDIVLAGSKN